MWDDKTWERYGALGAVWFVVLAVVGSLLGGAPPARGDSAADIAEWFADNDSAIQVGGFLLGLGVIGLVWWFGSLWRAMGRAEDSPRLAVIALAGFVFGGALATTGFSVLVGTAAGIDQLGEGSASLFQITSVALAFSSFGNVIMVGAVSGLAWRTGFLPKWIAQVGLVSVLASLLGSVGVASDADFFGFFGFVSFLVWDVWLLLVGLNLYQNAPADA